MATATILDRLAGVVIALCAAVLVATGVFAASPAVRSGVGLGVAEAGGYGVGDPTDLPAAVHDGFDRTLVVFARSTCAASLASRPALEETVAAAGRMPGVGVAMVVDSSPFVDREQEVAFARSVGIPESRVFTVELADLRVRYLPTVVEFDRTGRVVAVEEGRMDDALRSTLTATVESRAASTSAD